MASMESAAFLLTPAQRMSHRRNRFLAGRSELLAVARVQAREPAPA